MNGRPSGIALKNRVAGGDVFLREDVIKRSEEAARFILSTGATVRACASHMGVSKTTLHKDMRVRLREISPSLYAEVG